MILFSFLLRTSDCCILATNWFIMLGLGTWQQIIIVALLLLLRIIGYHLKKIDELRVVILRADDRIVLLEGICHHLTVLRNC